MRHLTVLLLLGCGMLTFLLGQEEPDRFPRNREEQFSYKVTVTVADEDNNPVKNARVDLGFHNINDFVDGYNNFLGTTNGKGEFSGEAFCRGMGTAEISKDGYYVSRKTFRAPSENNSIEELRERGRFEPENSVVEVMLKKIGKPHPMIVRTSNSTRISHKAPVIGEEVLFDLLKADWLPPHGDGIAGDLAMLFEGGYTDSDEYWGQVKIRCVNEHDGFIPITELEGEESSLKFPRFAPRVGYEMKDYAASYHNRGSEGFERLPQDTPVGYFLRLRTKVDDDGKITRALYGKLTDPIKFYHPDSEELLMFVRLHSYINTEVNELNLEFDQSTNLAPEAPQHFWALP